MTCKSRHNITPNDLTKRKPDESKCAHMNNIKITIIIRQANIINVKPSLLTWYFTCGLLFV